MQERADFNDKNLFVGIDVHFRNRNNSVYYEGQFLRSLQQPPKVETLVKLLKRNYSGTEYLRVYEAEFWIQRELKRQVSE